MGRVWSCLTSPLSLSLTVPAILDIVELSPHSLKLHLCIGFCKVAILYNATLELLYISSLPLVSCAYIL